MSTSTCPHCGTPLAPNAVICSTCGRSSSSSSLPPTQYASSPPAQYSGPPSPYASPAYPYSGSSSSSSNPYSSSPYAPPPPIAAPPAMQPQKKSHRGLWILLGSVGGFLLLVIILLSVLGSASPKSSGSQSTSSQSTPTQTLQSFCSALNTHDYQSAYNLASKRQQAQQTEAQFAANFKSVTNCKASNVNDSAGTGTLTYTSNNGLQLAAGETLVNENGTWKINNEEIRSTPTYTLIQYCNAVKKGDYQAAYNLLSNNQHKLASEQQFAANFKNPVTDCMVSSVDDSAGTGTIKYTNSNSTQTGNETLVNENGTWKINSEK